MLYILTGGTIDKRPHFLADGSFDNDSKDFGDTHLPEMLAKGRFIGSYTVRQLFMLDSLDMTDEHREHIGIAAEETGETSIVVTHGTDTMPETARFLKTRKQLGEKTIVLTGAMLPYSVGEESDAMFNVGAATAFAQTLPAGVYVAMNGQAFEADNVVKDRVAGVFKSVQ
jgi:L-asparaginase